MLMQCQEPHRAPCPSPAPLPWEGKSLDLQSPGEAGQENSQRCFLAPWLSTFASQPHPKHFYVCVPSPDFFIFTCQMTPVYLDLSLLKKPESIMISQCLKKKRKHLSPKMFYINLSIGSWFMSAPFTMKCPAWAVTPAKYNPLILLIFCKGPLKVHILQSGGLIASSQIFKKPYKFLILVDFKGAGGGMGEGCEGDAERCPDTTDLVEVLTLQPVPQLLLFGADNLSWFYELPMS